jgi:hypothetical protein
VSGASRKSVPAPCGHRSKWLVHLRQTVLPKPSIIATGKCKRALTKSHSSPPGNVQAPSTVPASVRPSMCQWIGTCHVACGREARPEAAGPLGARPRLDHVIEPRRELYAIDTPLEAWAPRAVRVFSDRPDAEVARQRNIVTVR